MQIKNNVISSNKDRRIYNILQDPDLNLADIFYDYINVNQVTKCWNWTGSKVMAGYGYIKIYSKEICYSHRLSYLIFKGLIPLRYQIDHLCKNKSCCNPDHLEAVTSHENKVRSGFLSRKHKRLTIEYFKKEIELQDQQYRDNISKMEKKLYYNKKSTDIVIMRKFKETCDSQV